MKTNEILKLNFKEEKSQEIIQKVLKSIKPLQKYSNEEKVPLESLEKLIGLYSRKYNFSMQWLFFYVTEPKENIWNVSLRNDNNFERIEEIFGHNLYELLSKVAILMTHLIKSGKIELRQKKKENGE